MPRNTYRDSKGRFSTNGNGHSLYSGASGRDMDLIGLHLMQQSVQNAATSLRSTLARRYSADDRRNINHEAGYPETTELTAQDYRDMFDRNPVANRVVHILPEESWASQPTVFEDEDSDTVTEFEQAWDDLGRNLRNEGEESWYQDEEGNPIWADLLRADVMSGIGSYGVILMGFNDGKSLNEPATAKAGMELLYIRVFDESLIRISQYNNDPASPRYGKPEQYAVTFSDPHLGLQTGIGLDLTSRFVHWSRVIHIADNLLSSEVLGIPRQQPVWNDLYDIQKIMAGDGEAFWRNVVMKLFFETHPQLGGEVSADASEMRDMMEAMMNGLQQWGLLSGMHANAITPSVVDPTPHFNAHIDSICIKLSTPKRIFVGSERGELASSQDARAWNDRVRARQRNHVTPRIIVPFVNRLIRVGVLPTPTGYSVHWPDPDVLAPTEKADVATKRVQALVAYTQGGGDTLMAPLDFLTRELGYDEEEAKTILENAMAHVQDPDEESASPLLGLVGGITGMTELFSLASQGGITQEQLKQLIMLFFRLDEERAEEIIADGQEALDQKEAERAEQLEQLAKQQPPAGGKLPGGRPAFGKPPTQAKPVGLPNPSTNQA